jgi:hypothetical protein
VGEDKAFDSADHMAKLHAINVTPHVAQNDSVTLTGKRRRSAIDGRTTRHEGYGMSQSRRAMTECIFGWGKQHGTMRKTKHRGRARVAADFLLNLIVYNFPNPQTARGVGKCSLTTPLPPNQARQKKRKRGAFLILDGSAINCGCSLVVKNVSERAKEIVCVEKSKRSFPSLSWVGSGYGKRSTARTVIPVEQ